MKRRALALILSLATATALLTACGGNNSGSDATKAATEAATTAAATEATEAASGEEGFESTIYPTPDGVTYKAIAEGKSAPDWTEYEALITEIKTTTDVAHRVELMHKAEDILMGTAAVIPIYYYNDLYLQKTDVEGIYSNLFGFKFFQFATLPRDVLKINLASEPAKVDPALNSSVDGACLAVNMFEGLYTYDKDGNLQPALAENTEVSEDGMTYTFTLRDGLKWSDGTDLTAKDFEYSWKRAAAPETGADYGYMFDAIAQKDGALDVTASEDGKTLTVNLVAPCAYFLDLAAFPAYLPVPQAQVEAAEGWETNPGAWAAEAGFVTNGAYTMESWKHEESIVLKKNDNYYRADEVSIPEIDLMLSADDTAILAAYNSGDLDFADTVPTNEIAALMEKPDFHVIDNLGTYYAAFNVNSPLFEGKTVDQAIAMRKAFAILIDRPYIVETVGQTGQKVATSYIPAGMADGNGGVFKENGSSYNFPVGDGYYPEEVQDAAIDEAISLLEYAGYKFDDSGKLSSETPINITYLTNDGTGHIAVAEIMQQDFAEIGINMTIDTREWNVFLDERKQGNFDFAREGWLADFNDPINMLEMWTSTSGNNDCQFGR
jgi:peptide/nickel transport system substrate-binding protein/oligopeptide transport system substrate-binding protein